MANRKPPNAGKGRPKGAPNKTTADVRAAISKLLHGAAPKFTSWLNRVAKEDPGRALDIVTRMAEYHIPKLARHEVANPDGEILTVRLVDMTGAKRAVDVDP